MAAKKSSIYKTPSVTDKLGGRKLPKPPSRKIPTGIKKAGKGKA